MLELAQDSTACQNSLKKIALLDDSLTRYFGEKLQVCRSLSRLLVSFQANKSRPIYRWYKYKEGFSATLIEFLLEEYKIRSGIILDPFAGSGAALFVAAEKGLEAEGIELLPIGQLLIEARKILQSEFQVKDFQALSNWANEKIWEKNSERVELPELRITARAYPPETKEAIERFLAALRKEKSWQVRCALEFALLSVLENVSYTRKDGQYLRWDERSGRRIGVKKPFHKGEIPTFSNAIRAKIFEFIEDLQGERQNSLFKPDNRQGEIKLYKGSCLEVMPKLPPDFYDAIITSPPYCNRYDYTRTYALELALLGVSEKGLVNLRQQLLSCTVENKAKDLISLNLEWKAAVEVADNQNLLQAIIAYLEREKDEGTLNNNGIPRMVRGYFYEMACVIAQSAKVLKSGAPLLMVNDNVRYAGASVSVDLILSDFAEKLGFYVEKILVLPSGKGNSSQQMGEHGRDVLRKCVYVWRKV